jgi:DNA mismatch repair ATPase MutS
LTLLAAANAAVAAVRKGCELYKEIKSVAGEAKDVIDDLKQQYEKIVDPTPAQKQQLHTEIQRVQEVAKSDPNDVYTEIGEQLGKLMDAYDALSKALLAEQMESKKVYRGEESVGRRALRRIIITTRLDAMLAEIRETMVFKSPPELGSLWGKFSEMWETIIAEQEEAHAEELKLIQMARWRRRKRIAELRAKATWISAVVFVVLWAAGLMWLTTRSATMRTSLGVLLITVMAVLLTFFIVMPIIGFMIYDMHYATQAAVYEAKKMRQLRKEILEERLYGK